jgi:hypothetical protein
LRCFQQARLQLHYLSQFVGLGHSNALAQRSVLIDACGGERPTTRSPLRGNRRLVDNSRNSARLPLYLAAGRELSNPPIIVVPWRSQTRHSHLVGLRSIIDTSSTAPTASPVVYHQDMYRALSRLFAFRLSDAIWQKENGPEPHYHRAANLGGCLQVPGQPNLNLT